MFNLEVLKKLERLKNSLLIEDEKVEVKAREIYSLTDTKLSKTKSVSKHNNSKKNTSYHFKELLLKDGSPKVEDALRILQKKLLEFRQSGVKVVRVVHGYGSEGRGGKLKTAIVTPLEEMKNDGRITDFILGEEFNFLHERAVELVNKYTFLKSDADYRNCNYGITMVIL